MKCRNFVLTVPKFGCYFRMSVSCVLYHKYVLFWFMFPNNPCNSYLSIKHIRSKSLIRVSLSRYDSVEMGTNRISAERTVCLFTLKKLIRSYSQNKKWSDRNCVVTLSKGRVVMSALVCKFSVIEQEAKRESELNFELCRLPVILLQFL